MISLLVPTRDRPGNVRTLIRSVCSTASGPVEFVFYVDDDAQYPPNVYNVPESRKDITVRVFTGPRIIFSDMWNKCAQIASYDIFGVIGDDVAFRTDGWDTIIAGAINSHPDKLAIAYGKDGVHPPPHCATQIFVSRRWAEVLGYVTPPYFSSDYTDVWMYELADSIGRAKYLPEVYTEHLHPIAGKSVWDQTYQEKQERHSRDNPQKIYNDREPERIRDTEILRKAMM